MEKIIVKSHAGINESPSSKPVVPILLNDKSYLFWIGLVIYLLSAILGWGKLKYGFNFIDEGMYMTDGWRMTVGDRLFPDNSTNAIFLYSIFNELIFKINPEITLHGFRQLQYCSAIFSMLFLAISMYRWSRESWYLPYALSLFSFTGLDVNGIASNFSYYVYPHLFITMHVAFLLFALKQSKGVLRDFFFVLSGFFLWGIGFSLLPLVVTLLSPMVLWFMFNRIYTSEHSFSVRDIVILYFPAILAWLIFFAVYGVDFIYAAFKMYHYINVNKQDRLAFLGDSTLYIVVSFLLVAMIVVIGRLKTMLSLIIAAGVSAAIFFVIETNSFGIIPSFWWGWFNKQMWFASFVVVSWVLVLYGVLYRCHKNHQLDSINQLQLVLIIPSIIMASFFVIFSSLGPLAVQYVSIPTMLALAVFFSGLVRNKGRSLALLVLTLWPFYFSMAWADWKFTYFDLPPRYLTRTIEDGFAKGIRTNQLYYSMALWMREMSERYSGAGDFAIVADQTPMGYMLINRRPALNHSWGWLGKSMPLRLDAVAQMMRDKREPKIAFRFVYAPMFMPDGGIMPGGERPIDPTDPVDSYMLGNMMHMGTYKFQQKSWIELYVR